MPERARASRPRIRVTSVNKPGWSHELDAIKYEVMRKALMKVLPRKAPGLTQKEMWAAVRPHLPAAEFPGGAKVAWWAKSVQLDQEAKRTIVREDCKPLRWHRAR